MPLGDRRLLHLEPGELRPLELGYSDAYEPAGILHQEEYTTFREFFKQSGPFTWENINRFIELESTWPIPLLPISVRDQGYLRLYIWNESRPTPIDHLEESALRLPIVMDCPNLRPFFSRFARSTFEDKRSTNTAKCPLCGSQYLGYPISDHQLQFCPFNVLEGEDRIKFISINNVSYCSDCNSRSGTHRVGDCRPKPQPCMGCGSYGHTTALGLCNLRIGEGDPEARAELYTTVDTIRHESLKFIQSRALEKNLFKYRSHVDSRYHFWERHASENLLGWKTYYDREKQFSAIPLKYYSNYARGLPAEFPSMRPAELFTKGALPRCPLFRDPLIKYFEEVGFIVTEVRSGRDIDTIILPKLPKDLGAGPAPAPTEKHQIQNHRPLVQDMDHASKVLTETPILIPARMPVREATPPHCQQRPLHQPPKVETQYQLHQSSSQTENSNRSHTTTQESNHLLSAPVQNSRPSMTKAQPSNPPLPESSSNKSETYDSRSRYSSISSADNETIINTLCSSDTTLISNPQGDSQVKKAEKLELEKEIAAMKNARMWCKEVLIIDSEPARASFEKEAFQEIPLELPNGHDANILRAQTLINILAGENEHTSFFADYSTEQLKTYNRFLTGIANAHKEEKIILITYQTHPFRVTSSQKRGSTTLMIPSIKAFHSKPCQDLFTNDIGYHWILPDHFPKGKWFRDPEDDKDVTEDPDLLNHYTKHTVSEYHTINLLPIPTQMRDLINRLRWLQPYISKEKVKEPLEEQPYHFIHGYVHLLMGVIRVMNAVYKDSPKVRYIKFSITNCPEQLAAAASNGITIAIPTYDLFKSEDMQKWRAWLEPAWTQYYDQRKWLTTLPYPELKPFPPLT